MKLTDTLEVVKIQSMNNPHVRKAIKKLGGHSQVARIFGVTRQAVFKWERERVPAERVPRLASLSGIKPDRIRPDIFAEIKA